MKISIALKVILVLIGLSMVLFVTYTIVAVQRQERFNRQINRDKALAVAFSLDTNIKRSEDLVPERLNVLIQKNILLNTDIVKINIIGKTNGAYQIISSNNLNQDIKTDEQIYDQVFKSDTTEDQLFWAGNTRIIRVITPIHGLGENIGVYEIWLSLANIDNQFIKETVFIIIVDLIMLLFYILISYLLLRRVIIQPLFKMHAGFQEVSKNNFDFQLSFKSGDEYEDMANEFNLMVKDLKRSHQERKQHEVELEAKIQERTGQLEESKKILEDKLLELERMNKLMIGRELRMTELKKEIEELKNVQNKN